MKKTISLVVLGVLAGFISTVFALSTLFSDVPANSWYSSAVSSLAEKGIIKGYEDNTFRPENNVNRAELAVRLDRLINYIEGGEYYWSLLRNYVTTNYPVSEEYFDEHLGYLSLETDAIQTFESGQGYVVSVPDVKKLNYSFYINDDEGNQYEVEGGWTSAYFINKQVIDTGNIPGDADGYERQGYSSRSYDKYGVTKEYDEILITKEEAIALTTDNCNDPQYFSFSNLEEDIYLFFTPHRDKFEWFVYSTISGPGSISRPHCIVNAETGAAVPILGLE